MRLSLTHVAGCFHLSVFVAVATTAIAASRPYVCEEVRELPPPRPGVVYGDKIRRTMHLLSTSTKERPNKVKILFYGQSITAQGYSTRIIQTSLIDRFPHAQLIVANKAIGGFQVPRLVHTMYYDVFPFQPDLIVFHAYGEGGLETLVKGFRTRTTAEIVLVTHHLDNYSRARTRQKDVASARRRRIGDKYGCELVEVREQWRRYLDMHSINAAELLRDKVHHNRHGGELWGSLQLRHFEVQEADPQDWQNSICTLKPAESSKSALAEIGYDETAWQKRKGQLVTSSAGSPLKITFTGTRVDIICSVGSGSANLILDGKRPTEHLETWAASRPATRAWRNRPAVLRIGLGGTPVEERWTLTVDSVSPSCKEFSYSVSGSVTGTDGKGDHTGPFTSDSGIVVLKPEYFGFNWFKGKQEFPSLPARVTWKVYPMCSNTWQCRAPDKRNPSGQVTLLQCLANRRHQLEIVPNGDGEICISEIKVFRPETDEETGDAEK